MQRTTVNGPHIKNSILPLFVFLGRVAAGDTFLQSHTATVERNLDICEVQTKKSKPGKIGLVYNLTHCPTSYVLHLTSCVLCFTSCILHLASCVCLLHLASCVLPLRLASCLLHLASCVLQPVCYVLHLPSNVLHHTSYVLRPTLCVLSHTS